MVDRLAELKGASSLKSNPLAPGGGDLEMGRVESTDNDKKSEFMADFFGEVEVIKKGIKRVQAATIQIQEYNQRMMLATTAEAEAEVSRELNPLVQHTSQAAKKGKEILDKIMAATTALQEKSKKGENVNEIRIRENLGRTLSRKFVETIKAFQKAQQDYKDDVKRKVARQVRIVKEDATDEEIEEVSP